MVIKKREEVYSVLCAAGWSLRESDVRVPAVGPVKVSDNQPYDYSYNEASLTGCVYTKE